MSINVQDDENNELQDHAIFLFSIIPSQALLGNKHTQLDLLYLEFIAKIRFFYISNIEKELQIYSKDIIKNELKEKFDQLTSIQQIEILENKNIIIYNKYYLLI
ncbi:8861_t:CDS:2 [Cetraspora pellucida]|uniref:8861_t:CDS:1 n=1 Tax=Cetraspora pellucida TaxID=1433469 RepID=A0A9N9FYM6_9GLOM|nr:8861_t:CDS:2 [Cetraspora pellucida]